ncbi:hypothetical protein HK104_005375 [Borealophlyctis nickersoniae]|nr:hypothetical protein HK104_005375 [Borealophlyctis nickersoniae]
MWGFMQFCDRDSRTWDSSLFYYSWFFYLSKYYEIVDTMIILMKVFNSFIHTLMYFYYTLTTLSIQPPGKQYLTRMQISQFLIGGSVSVSYVLIPGCLKREKGMETWERWAYTVAIGYLVPLTVLFVDFARRAYGGRKGKTA